MREPIPAFQLPLLPCDDEPIVELNRLLHDLYDRAGFDLRLDYTPPPDSPLPAEDATWAAELLRARRLGDRRPHTTQRRRAAIGSPPGRGAGHRVLCHAHTRIPSRVAKNTSTHPVWPTGARTPAGRYSPARLPSSSAFLVSMSCHSNWPGWSSGANTRTSCRG
ncbi:MAG: DUF4058 family protein [Anaerolineae bacterium]|nr:MAG: DUF4058 family protein [Anaerolineae bacterium]